MAHGFQYRAHQQSLGFAIQRKAIAFQYFGIADFFMQSLHLGNENSI
jgi:hypothetical protein